MSSRRSISHIRRLRVRSDVFTPSPITRNRSGVACQRCAEDKRSVCASVLSNCTQSGCWKVWNALLLASVARLCLFRAPGND